MTNVSAAESATAKLLGEDEARRIATNIAEHARQYARRHVRWHTHTGCGEPVEKQWETCRRSQKKYGVVFIWSRRAEERGACWLVDTALSFKSFRTVLGRAFFSSDCSFVRALQHAFRAIVQD